VYALAVDDDGVLYAGGALGDQGEGGGGIVRWGDGGWALVGGGLSMYSWPGVVTDIVTSGHDVDVVGCFVTAGGATDAPGAVTSRSVARWSADHWVSLDDGTKGVLSPWFEPLVCGDESLTAVWDVELQRAARVGERLFVGGSFPGVAGVASNAIASYDGTWHAAGGGGLGLNGSLDRIEAAGDCTVYGFGQFSHVAGVATRAHVVRFDGDHWSALTDTIAPDAYCAGFAVSATGDVAVGCMDFPLEGDAFGSVLVDDGDRLVRLPITVDLVQALAYAPSGRLWVGGGGGTGFLGYVEGGALTIVADGFDGPVQLIEVVDEDHLIIGGGFTHVGSEALSRVARFDGTTFTALGDGLPGQVLALGHDGATVYASSYEEGAGYYVLGAFDGSEWRELATPEAGLTADDHFSFNRIRAVDGTLVLVGTAELDDGSGRGALLYRDGHFTALGGGVGAISASGLAITEDSVWIGGLIAQAGQGGARVPSVGVARWTLSR